MSHPHAELRRAVGDQFTSINGFVWVWSERFGVYVCGTPDCNALEVDPHSDACVAAAEARRKDAA